MMQHSKNTKKIVFLLLTFCMATNTYFTQTFATNTDVQKVYTVGFAQDTMANDWRSTQVRQFAEFFKPYPNIRFIYTDGKGNTAKQIQDIEDMLYSKIDVLITSPRDSAAMTPIISRAYKQGIPVVLVTRSIQSNDYTCFVAPDDEKIARQAAQFLVKRLNGKGHILVLKGVPTATTAIFRTQGFLAEIKKHPGIKIAAVLNGNYLRGDTIKVLHKALKDGLKFDAIYAQSDSMASGARLALKKAGINPAEKHIVGIDYIQEARDAIIHGEQAASFVYPTSVKQTGDIVLQILQGKKVPRKVSVDSQRITIKNVHQIKPIF